MSTYDSSVDLTRLYIWKYDWKYWNQVGWTTYKQIIDEACSHNELFLGFGLRTGVIVLETIAY